MILFYCCLLRQMTHLVQWSSCHEIEPINLTLLSLSSSTIIKKRHCSTWHCSSISQCTKWKRLCFYWLLFISGTIIHQHLSQWYGHTRSPTSTVVLLTTEEDF